MKILDACISFYRIMVDGIHLLDEADVYKFYDTVFIEKIQKNLSILQRSVELLHQWHIPPEVFDFDMIYSEQQIIEFAKELIGTVCSCIDDKCVIINQKSFSSTIACISEEEKEDYMIRFMEKYLKAASMYSGKTYEETKKFFIYAFDIDEEDVSDVLNKLENRVQHLIESRNAFILAVVSWNRKKTDEKDGTAFVSIQENEKKSDTAGREEFSVQNSWGVSEQIDAIEDNKNDEYENLDSASEVTKSVGSDVFESDIYDAFYQIMVSTPECIEESEEKSDKKIQPTALSEVTGEGQAPEEDAESRENECKAQQKIVGKEDSRRELEEEIQLLPKEGVWGNKKEAEIQQVKAEVSTSTIDEINNYSDGIGREEVVGEAESKKEVQRIQQRMEEKKENRERLEQEIQLVSKEKILGEEKETAVHQLKQPVDVVGKMYVHKELDGFQKECVQLLQKRLNKLEKSEKIQPSDDSETDCMCWKLLLKGEFILAREFAVVFRETSSGKCVNPAVIDVVGSGLSMPVTEKDTQQYFLFYQSLLQFNQLDSQEQKAVVLAMLPIAHCCYDVCLDSAMLQVLPDVFRKWASEVVEFRKEITYIDRTVIENYRLYQIRMKKIKDIQKKASQQLDSMLNSNLSYEGANKILTVVCGRDQCIGILWALMNELEPEYSAVGIANPKVKELYRQGRSCIPKKKNMLKSIDEGLINRVIEDGRKKYGYKTEVVGTSRHKMMQMIGDFLMLANEWLELISSPCNYNRYDSSSKFVQNLSESYQRYRAKLYQYAKEQEREMYLLDIFHNTLVVMDYLMGIQEDRPKGHKSYLEHIYRLCAIPNLYIKKNEMGIYQCECKNSIEHLRFLMEIVINSPCSADSCLKKFIEADAFSGCSIIFDILERIQPDNFMKIKEHYDWCVQKRLSELKNETAQMKRDLYRLSIYAGWLGDNYLSTLSRITMLEQMIKEETCEITLVCASVKECSGELEILAERFRDILRCQVKGNFNEEQSNKLHTLIEEGQYAAVIEWTAHINISDVGVEETDFFKERYFNYNIYNRKEKSLLQQQKKDLVGTLQTAIKRTNSWEGFDFNRVPRSIGNRRMKLIQLWYQIKSELQSVTRFRKEDNSVIYDNLEQMLKALGWDVTRLEGCGFCEDESGGYLQFDMFFKATHSRERCPIPLFGSDSGGRIRMICLYGNTNAPDKQYDLFENKNQQIPMIILFFGVMTHKRRMELYDTALDKQSSFLVVDDIIITTICERRESMLLRWLYILAVPFSVQKLYTAALGVVHPEMFYGRLSAKTELGLNGTVCAVYGGRQLGKTALLKNIESESHNPEIDHFVYYIPLPTVAVENTDVVLTKEIVNSIQNDILGDKRCENMAEVLEVISDWIRQKETHRLLLLLDEADEFLLADGKGGFRVTSSINRVMTISNLRFKVVFAGLHNVYRSISSPNNPLAHYGKPISIGPLLADELQDAVNLIRQPFEIMGYRFENLDLIIWILAETNYYPSLIQLFCMKLHDYLHQPEVRKQRRGTLPVIICKKDIDSVLKDQTLKKSICERFMWTLDLDDRYKAIVLSIAFDAGHASQTDLFNDFVKGYDLHWIRQEIEKWPNLFKGHSSLDELRGLCDELIQLGILRSVSSERYTLRSANILYMLGTQESILRRMYELESRHYDYDKMYNGTLYRSIFHDREFGCKCYPLTNQQIHSALDTGGVKLIIGSRMLGIDSVEQCLRELLALDIDHPSSYDLYQQKAYRLYVHHTNCPGIDELGDSLSIHLVYWECAWNIEDLQNYKQGLDDLDEQSRPVLLLLCDEKRSRELQECLYVDTFDVPVIRLTTWNLEAVQFWLNESSAPPLLMEDLLQIMERLCGWPVAMYQLWNLLTAQRQVPSFNQVILDQTVTCLADASVLSGFLVENKLEPLLFQILDIYAEYETDMSCEDIQYILEEEGSVHSIEHIEHVMTWMADMRLLNRKIQDKNISEGDEKMKYIIDSLILELWKRQAAYA